MLRIATYNVLNLFDGKDEAEQKVLGDKVAYLAKRIAESDADVVALQEIGSEKLLQVLVLSLGKHASYMHRAVGSPDARGIRNALISRVPIRASRVLISAQLDFPRFIAADPLPFGPRLPLRRGVVHAEIEAGALGVVDLLVVHFKSGRGVPLRAVSGEPIAPASAREFGEGMVRALVWRSAEALFVRAAVDELSVDPSRKIAVVGDYNDVPDSVPVRIVRGGGPALLHSAADLVPAEKRFTILHNGEKKMIDHVLVSTTLRDRLRGAQIYNEDLREFDSGLSDIARADSDHALVVAAFE